MIKVSFALSFGVIISLCYKIAIDKGRSGWWGILGLLHMLGLLFVLYLPRLWNNNKANKKSNLATTQKAEPLKNHQVNNSNKSNDIQKGRRKKQTKKEINDLLYLLKILLNVIAYMWITIGLITFLVFLYRWIANLPLIVNDTVIELPILKFIYVCFPLIFISIGLLYLHWSKDRTLKHEESKRIER